MAIRRAPAFIRSRLLGLLRESGALARGVERPLARGVHGVPREGYGLDVLWSTASHMCDCMDVLFDALEECQLRDWDGVVVLVEREDTLGPVPQAAALVQRSCPEGFLSVLRFDLDTPGLLKIFPDGGIHALRGKKVLILTDVLPRREVIEAAVSWLSAQGCTVAGVLSMVCPEPAEYRELAFGTPCLGLLTPDDILMSAGGERVSLCPETRFSLGHSHQPGQFLGDRSGDREGTANRDGGDHTKR